MATLISYEGFHMLNLPKSDELPPKMYLMQILDPVTKLYCYLWENKDKLNRIYLDWPEVSKLYNKNFFRTSLRKLNGFALLDYKDDEKGVLIELVGWVDMEEFD